MQNNGSNSGTVKEKNRCSNYSQHLLVSVFLETLGIFEDFKIGMVKLIRLRGRSF